MYNYMCDFIVKDLVIKVHSFPRQYSRKTCARSGGWDLGFASSHGPSGNCEAKGRVEARWVGCASETGFSYSGYKVITALKLDIWLGGYEYSGKIEER